MKGITRKDMKTLTVITTTYNRSYCLHQVYESLCRQTVDDFIWMIIDDGSTDNTSEIVKQWEHEGKIEIIYYYKENGGMHTARNYAYDNCETVLNVIIDSDDWMTDDAVEQIISCWKKHGNERLYGIIAENVDTKGQILGTELPSDVNEATSIEIFGKYGVKGDKKLVLRSELSKLYRYPEFEGERFFPASYKFKMLDQKYKLYIFKYPVCVVDYNPDSMTYHKYAQYKTCCRGFAFYRNAVIKISKSPKVLFSEAIHYIAESRFSGNRHFIKESSKPYIVLLAMPFGLLYSSYLKRTSKEY